MLNNQTNQTMNAQTLKAQRKAQIIANLINDGGKATFAKVTAIVEQKMLKRGNPLASAEITKKVTYQMLLNANYQNMVNKQRERENKEANFVSQENWFKKLNDGFNGSIVAKKSDENCLYLFFACNNAETHTYYVNGNLATNEETEIIKQFKQKNQKAVNQGLDNDVVVRTIKMKGIQTIKCGEILIFA
jgi:superfamily II DNA/RNA helicase